jgi:hypothetical protein
LPNPKLMEKLAREAARQPDRHLLAGQIAFWRGGHNFGWRGIVRHGSPVAAFTLGIPWTSLLAQLRTASSAVFRPAACLGMTRSTRLHVFVQHHQHPGQKQKHRGNNGMTPKREGHPKDCNDESNQCHPATSK